MKTKTLLLAGLSVFALTSCGGIQNYKTIVKQSTFKESVKKLANDNPILNPDNPYSFSMEQTQEMNLTTTFIKNGSQISKEQTIVKAHGIREFDSENVVYHEKSEGEEIEETASEKKTTKFNYDVISQVDSKSVFEVDLKAKTYKKENSKTPSLDLSATAMSSGLGVMDSFLLLAENPDCKFYIENERIYTIEEIITEEDTSETKNVKSVYQLIINNDGYEYYSTSTTEIKELNLTIKNISSSSMIFKKKNVKIDSVSLTKYLEYDEEDYQDLLDLLNLPNE